MTYLSVIEKFKILFDMLLKFKLVFIFAILILLITFVYMFKKISSRKYMLIVSVLMILMFGVSIVSNYKILMDTFDNFSTIFFRNIYFPSIYVYIGILVFNFVVFITSVLSAKKKKIYKVINTINFILNNILFAIVLNIIAKNKIDIFSMSSLYTNTSLVAILELSIGTFAVWLFCLLVIYITNVICDRIMIKKKAKNKVETKEVVTEIVANTDKAVEDNKDDKKSTDKVLIPNGNVVMAVNPNTVVIDNKNKKKENKKKKKSVGITFDDILNGKVPVTYYDNNVSSDSSYNIVNPQKMYEESYNVWLNDISSKSSMQDIIDDIKIEDNTSNIENTSSVESSSNIENTSNAEEPIIDNYFTEEVVPMEDKNAETINSSLEDNVTKSDNISLIENTSDTKEEVEQDEDVTLNDLIDVKENKVEENNNYTVEDYKKFAKMLSSLKSYTDTSDISVDDAIAISLINDYSIDDCVMFKDMLKSSLC